MELASNTEEKTDIQAATEIENSDESKRTGQGPDIQLTEPEAEKVKGSKPGEEPVKAKEESKVDPEKVIEALKASKDQGKESKGDFNKGLQHVQADLASVKRELAASNQERSEIKDLLKSLASKDKTPQDKLDVLSELAGEEIVDGQGYTKGLRAVVEHLDGKIDELKKSQKSAVDEIREQSKPRPREMSTQEVVSHIEGMFPDLDKQYAPWIYQQASPQMEQYKRDFPNATQSEQSLAATNFLTEQAYEVRLALARESGGSVASSEKSKPKKPTGSTKIVNDSASPATTVKTGRGTMMSVQDAIDKYLNMPE